MATARTKRIIDYLPYLNGPLALRLNTTRVQARGILNPQTGQVTVLRGSGIEKHATPSMRPGVDRLREELLRSGIVAQGVFATDWVAANPSEASNVILASRTTGLVEWKAGTVILREFLERLKEAKSNKIWVDGHWRDVPASVEAVASEQTKSEFMFLRKYVEHCTANDPYVGIRVSLYRK